MTTPSLPTRTEQTKKTYLRRARDLAQACRKSLKIPNNTVLDYRQLVGWLANRRPRWSKRTWRQYKASVAYFLEEEIKRGNGIAQEALEALIPLDSTPGQAKTKSTSANKQKKLPAADLRALRKALDESTSVWASDLERWIEAGLLTGLRPVEWGQSRVEYSPALGPILVVNNAKSTNGRSHGPKRTLLLSGLTAEERNVIEEHVARAQEWAQAGQYDRFYHGCSLALSRIVRKRWPNRDSYISLYSLRHQFAANAKASGFTRLEIAAMMGHAVDDTAAVHYGRKRAGFDLVRITPDPADVAKVKAIYTGRPAPPSPNDPTPGKKFRPAVPTPRNIDEQ